MLKYPGGGGCGVSMLRCSPPAVCLFVMVGVHLLWIWSSVVLSGRAWSDVLLLVALWCAVVWWVPVLLHVQYCGI